MFDAKSILEGIVRGAAPAGQQPQGGGGLSDILGEIGRQLGNQQGMPRQGNGGTDSGGGWGDILGELQRQLGQAQPPRQATNEAPSSGSSGGIGDILGQIKDQLNQSSGNISGGGIADILGKVLTQATTGAKEGASRIGEATGATTAARDAIGKATGGQTPEELLARLKELIQQNPLAAGTAAGGLGGLILGTRTGRAAAGTAARIGALALIGGLAYKAFQNYQTGKPLITGLGEAEAAPQGSGFEPSAVTNEAATHYIQSMIAAAAADGRVDNSEQAKIIGSLKQAGLDSEAEEFLANELNNPKTPESLATLVNSPEEAIQLYTAARIAIALDSPAEQQFLARLANALGIDPKLAANIDAVTRASA